ncbi:MAG: HD domain-containing protein [Schaedlerella sp.]|nr:HD domain-containing protein [Schaedlerella sp.]
MNAKEVFLTYAGNFDRNDGRIELKIVHTLAVADIMDRLTESLHLPEHLKSLAHICAMFHDIGRFEQVKQYGTFLALHG